MGQVLFGWYIGKNRADSGEEMIIIDGKVRDPAVWDSRFLRVAAQLSGTFYSPRVFDVIRCSFKHYDAATVAKARLPWLVYFVERPGHISRRYEELQSDTSDEFIWDLTSIFETMDLHSVTSYTIPWDVDDTPLMWSRIENLEPVGPLLQAGQTQPLLQQTLAVRRAEKRRRSRLNKLVSEDQLRTSVGHICVTP